MSSDNEISEGRETALYAGKVFMGLGVLGLLCGIPPAWRFIQDFSPANTRLFCMLSLGGAVLFAIGNLLRRASRIEEPLDSGYPPSNLPFDEQIRRLETLKAEGLVTDDEYNDLRLKILERLR
jgi:hypothetical protein